MSILLASILKNVSGMVITAMALLMFGIAIYLAFLAVRGIIRSLKKGKK